MDDFLWFVVGGLGATAIAPALVAARNALRPKLERLLKRRAADRVIVGIERDPYFGREYLQEHSADPAGVKR